jgi:trehalose-6-phosphatase
MASKQGEQTQLPLRLGDNYMHESMPRLLKRSDDPIRGGFLSEVKAEAGADTAESSRSWLQKLSSSRRLHLGEVREECRDVQLM